MKKKKSKKRLNNKGFSLIELMVVLVIIGILLAVVGPKMIGKTDDAKITKARIDIKNLETALKMYKLDSGLYPSTEQGLQALVQLPEVGVLPKKWQKGGYLDKPRVPKDPWGNEYIYLSPGVNGDYDIISYGQDGVQGGEDYNKDISNSDIE